MSAEELHRLLATVTAANAAPKSPFSVQVARDTWYVEHDLTGLPNSLQHRMEHVGHVDAEWLWRSDAAPDKAILYLHGGGYICGSIATHRPLTFELAKSFDGAVVSLGYRLAPEHPFPAALEDAVDYYRHLVELGYSPSAIALGGDSAAGGLVAGMLLKLRDEGLPLPGAGWIVSPFSDLTMSGETLHTRAKDDPIVFLESLEVCTACYLGAELLPSPYASPADADLTGLPPLLIQVGSKEILLDDALRLARTAALGNVDTTLEIWPNVPHVWHLMSSELSEGREAIARAANWLNDRLFA